MINVWYNFLSIKEWSSDSVSLKDLYIGIVVMWFWLEHQISFNLFKEWIKDLWIELQRISSYELVINPLLSTFFVCSSCSSRVLHLRRFVCRHRILYLLWLRSPFPNNARTLRPKASIKPNQKGKFFESHIVWEPFQTPFFEP